MVLGFIGRHWCGLLALELDLIGLPASDPLRDTRRQVRCLIRRRLHAPAPFTRKLCDTIASVSSNAYNFAHARITALAARHLRHHATPEGSSLGLTPPALVDASGNLAPPGSQWRRQKSRSAQSRH